MNCFLYYKIDLCTEGFDNKKKKVSKVDNTNTLIDIHV